MLAERAKSDSDSDADAYFIALGDLNIVGPGHATMDAPRTNSFVVPKSNSTTDAYASCALWRTHQMSDHLPMGVELCIDFTQEYLNDIEARLGS